MGIQGTREDTRRKDNIVDGFNDVASRNDVARRMTVIDFAIRNDVGSIVDGCNGVDGCKDISRRISRRITVFDNEIWLGMLTNGVLTKDVDRCSDMLTKGVDGCKGISSRMRVIIIHIRRKRNNVDGCNGIASRRRTTVIDIVGRIMVVDNEICLKYGLRRCVDRCQDISRGMTIIDVFDVVNRITVIDNGVDGCMDVSSIFSRIIVVDKNVLGIDGCTGMLIKGVDGGRDVFSRMTIIDIFSKKTVVEIWLNQSLRRCVHACNDISSRRTLVDFDALSRLASRMRIIDNEI